MPLHCPADNSPASGATGRLGRGGAVVVRDQLPVQEPQGRVVQPRISQLGWRGPRSLPADATTLASPQGRRGESAQHIHGRVPRSLQADPRPQHLRRAGEARAHSTFIGELHGDAVTPPPGHVYGRTCFDVRASCRPQAVHEGATAMWQRQRQQRRLQKQRWGSGCKTQGRGNGEGVGREVPGGRGSRRCHRGSAALRKGVARCGGTHAEGQHGTQPLHAKCQQCGDSVARALTVFARIGLPVPPRDGG